MSTVHRPYRPNEDWDRNWQTRIAADRARRAIEDQRHARNAELARGFAEALGAVVVGVLVSWGLVSAYRAGLFAWLRF